MVQSVYAKIGETFKKHDEALDELRWERLVSWRRGPTFVRVERPLNIARARALGYRAKPGYAVVRAKVRRGGLQVRAIRKGRKPSARGIAHISPGKSLQRIAEERVAGRYTNMEVLASYNVGQDGKAKYFEVILVDPAHPSILADPKINWIADPQHRGRVYRGLTPAGMRGRGLRWKGKGSEKARIKKGK